jgi:hypothetical protein
VSHRGAGEVGAREGQRKLGRRRSSFAGIHGPLREVGEEVGRLAEGSGRDGCFCAAGCCAWLQEGSGEIAALL